MNTSLESKCRALVKKWRHCAKENYSNASTACPEDAILLKTSAAVFSWVAEELTDELSEQLLPKRKRRKVK